MDERVSRDAIRALFELPFPVLLRRAMNAHADHHDPTTVQWSTLLSIKTGACPEDCSYCSQSARHATELEREPLMDLDQVLAAARAARDNGSTRFCMGAAWRRVSTRDTPRVAALIQAVKDLGLETCVTLGTITEDQARTFAEAGLDYYNHNLDTSREHYARIITTRSYDERLQTLAHVRAAGVKVCCGGILGLGETREDRVGFLWQLANLPEPPESVPINELVPVPGTPLADAGVEKVDPFEFVRTIAVARVLMPSSMIRLSAGRLQMNDELQALCFLAGANSLFTGDTLLTTGNPAFEQDRALLARLGMVPATLPEGHAEVPVGPAASADASAAVSPG
jgi:biotin synthase